MVRRTLLPLTIFAATLTSSHPPARAQSYSVAAGTILHCRLSETLTTRVDYVGDRFTANISEPILLNGHEVVPVGATLEGKIEQLERAGRLRGVGAMRLAPVKLRLPDGHSFAISAVLQSAHGAEGARVEGGEGMVKGPSSRLQTAAEVSGLAAGGGLLGLAIAHPILGLALGGGAGLVDRARRRGKDLTLPQGTELNYQLTQDLDVPAARVPSQ
jgi:hypothetical protein